MSTQNTEIKILGKSYAVRSDVDDRFVEETADLVDQKMRELLSKSGALSAERVAVLTAMNFAGQLLRERRTSTRLRSTFRERAQKLMKMIEEAL